MFVSQSLAKGGKPWHLDDNVDLCGFNIKSFFFCVKGQKYVSSALLLVMNQHFDRQDCSDEDIYGRERHYRFLPGGVMATQTE